MCGATVDKLDTTADRKTTSYDLSKIPGAQSLVPSAAGGLDGCLAYQAEYDSNASSFYTITPAQAGAKPDGTKDYRVLGFSIPAMQLIKNMPAGANLADPPHLELGPNSALKVIPASEWRATTDIDLSTYAPARQKLGNQLIERSGDHALLRIFAADPATLSLAVADTKSKTVVSLQSPPQSTALNVHLAPGGAAVLIEETEPAGKHAKTGKLILFDAATGRALGDFSGPHVRDQYFLAIAPTGKAVYHSADLYSFIDLARTFAAAPVSRPSDSSNPAVFFADR
jgi:hypothetical protein